MAGKLHFLVDRIHGWVSPPHVRGAYWLGEGFRWRRHPAGRLALAAVDAL